MAVLDRDFHVRGVEALRVVDASVFPHIPGTLLASAVYMISEKASDVLIREHAGTAALAGPGGVVGHGRGISSKSLGTARCRRPWACGRRCR